MPPLHPLAVLCDHTFQKLELCLGAPPRRAPQKQVALPDDVLVRTSVVSGHGRFAPEEHPYCPSETSSCSWRHVSCRYHYDCAQKTRSKSRQSRRHAMQPTHPLRSAPAQRSSRSRSDFRFTPAESFGTILAVQPFNRLPLATAINRLQDAV
jgi:hypothetical protein